MQHVVIEENGKQIELKSKTENDKVEPNFQGNQKYA